MCTQRYRLTSLQVNCHDPAIPLSNYKAVQTRSEVVRLPVSGTRSRECHGELNAVLSGAGLWCDELDRSSDGCLLLLDHKDIWERYWNPRLAKAMNFSIPRLVRFWMMGRSGGWSSRGLTSCMRLHAVAQEPPVPSESHRKPHKTLFTDFSDCISGEESRCIRWPGWTFGHAENQGNHSPHKLSLWNSGTEAHQRGFAPEPAHSKRHRQPPSISTVRVQENLGASKWRGGSSHAELLLQQLAAATLRSADPAGGGAGSQWKLTDPQRGPSGLA